jgi:hypothetical protein
MRANMRNRSRGIFALAIVMLGAAASCSSGSGAPQTDGFVGAWTFTSGMITPNCGAGLTVPPFSLAGLPVVFTKLDDSTIQLQTGNAGCMVKFKVSGATASAEAGSTCMLDVGGALGPQNISINTWTLALSGDRIDSNLSGGVIVCTAMGSGVLMRGAGDAGATD